MNPVARRPSPAFLATLAVLLALGHAVLAVTATAGKSMTSDEIAHLTAGHAYNTRGDFRLQPENGNLPQRWAALPARVIGAPLPPPTLAVWDNADVWNYGHAFFYRAGLPGDLILFAGRAMIALFSAALGLAVFFWSRAWFGWRGAFLSLGFYALCPAFLAHGALATSDVTMAFFFLAATGAWARHLAAPGWRWALTSGVALGLACVAKFSAVLLGPIFALVAAAWLLWGVAPGSRAGAARRLALTCAGHVAGAWAIIWLFYGFRFSAFAPEFAAGAGFNHGWPFVLQGLGALGRVLEFLRDWRVLPEAFLYGFAFVVQFAQQRGAFLNGDYSLTGWVVFFPYTFLVKTTPAFLALLVLGAGVGMRAWLRRTAAPTAAAVRGWLWRLAPLLALFAVYWATSLASNLNIGHRHILPTYPVLFILVGALGPWLGVRTWKLAAPILVLGAWHAAESVRIRPHYLAYFNGFAGGPREGWRHLVDSSLDWGQDLPGLKTWLDANAPRERVFLSYFGTGDPGYEGIRATLLPMLPLVHNVPRPWHALESGVYAVGATMLQHVYSPVRGAWTLSLENEYTQLRALEPVLLEYARDPARRAALLRDAPEENWHKAWNRYELLRFARLCHYLRVREADAQIGYSMLVYRLTAEEVAAATGGSLAEWSAAIERAVAQRGG
jgi:hypothetical protein